MCKKFGVSQGVKFSKFWCMCVFSTFLRLWNLCVQDRQCCAHMLKMNGLSFRVQGSMSINKDTRTQVNKSKNEHKKKEPKKKQTCWKRLKNNTSTKIKKPQEHKARPKQTKEKCDEVVGQNTASHFLFTCIDKEIEAIPKQEKKECDEVVGFSSFRARWRIYGWEFEDF